VRYCCSLGAMPTLSENKDNDDGDSFFKGVRSKILSAQAALDDSYVREMPEMPDFQPYQTAYDGDSIESGSLVSLLKAEDDVTTLDGFWERMRKEEADRDREKDEEMRKVREEVLLQHKLERGAKAEAKIFILQSELQEARIEIEALKIERERGWDKIVDKLLNSGTDQSLEVIPKHNQRAENELYQEILAKERAEMAILLRETRGDNDTGKSVNDVVLAAAETAQALSAEKAKNSALMSRLRAAEYNVEVLTREKDSFRAAAVALAKERDTATYYRERTFALEKELSDMRNDLAGMGSLEGVVAWKEKDVVRKPRVWRYQDGKARDDPYPNTYTPSEAFM